MASIQSQQQQQLRICCTCAQKCTSILSRSTETIYNNIVAHSLASYTSPTAWYVMTVALSCHRNERCDTSLRDWQETGSNGDQKAIKGGIQLSRNRWQGAISRGTFPCTFIIRRSIVEAQVAPSFCTGAPKHEKLRFSAEIDGFVRASCWTQPQTEYFCRSWTCVRESPTLSKVVISVKTLTFSMERQTLQKHFWTWSIFEWPSAWWLILRATVFHILTYIIQDHG